MSNIAQQLADALRRVLPYAENVADDAFNIDTAPGQDDVSSAKRTLAAFDAQKDTERAPAGRHTAEPWQVDAKGWRVIVPRSRPEYCDDVIFDIATGLDESDNAVHLANARRIVACVNACAGIDTPDLEQASHVALIPSTVTADAGRP